MHARLCVYANAYTHNLACSHKYVPEAISVEPDLMSITAFHRPNTCAYITASTRRPYLCVCGTVTPNVCSILCFIVTLYTSIQTL